MTTGVRLRASLIAVAVCAVCSVWSVPAQPAAAAPATPAVAATASSVPPYLTPRDARFTLNDKWHGTVPAATPGVEPANLKYYLSAPGDPGQAVWAPTCGGAQQTVTFTRTVELLGPPSSAEFDWLPYYTPGSVWFLRPGVPSPSGAVTSLELSVNGDEVFHQAGAGSSSFTFPAGVFKDFKVGANTFVLKATRAALPTGSTACNRAGQKLMVALLAVFHFYFATDLRVGVPAEKLRVVKEDTKVYSQVVSEFVENLGPDRALDGDLNVFHGTAGSVRLVTTGSHSRFCDQYPGSNTQYSCSFDQLDPGQRLSVIMDVTFTRPAGSLWDHEDEGVQFKAYSPTPDTDYENNESDVSWILFCSTTSTFPACNTANTSNSGGTAGATPTTTATPVATPPSPTPPGSYGLASGLTQVSNAQGGALTINPSADNAELNHTGKYGGAGNGGDWKVAYSWKLPPRLILGKPVPITIAAVPSDVNPKQPESFSINVLAPNLAEQLVVNYPPNGPSSRNIQYTLAPDENAFKDITVTIGFESSSVTYHYKRGSPPTVPPSPKPPSPTPPGSYGLASGLTQVSNAQGGALTIHPSADNAELNHTGKYGGAGNGGDWKVAYSWKLPPRLILGKPVPITIAAVPSDVNPKQPESFSINVLAPNLAEQLVVNYPPNGPSSKTIQYTLAPDENVFKDITVTIGFESSSVTYHYRSA